MIMVSIRVRVKKYFTKVRSRENPEQQQATRQETTSRPQSKGYRVGEECTVRGCREGHQRMVITLLGVYFNRFCHTLVLFYHFYYVLYVFVWDDIAVVGSGVLKKFIGTARLLGYGYML
jgi:hypothetical protein